LFARFGEGTIDIHVVRSEFKDEAALRGQVVLGGRDEGFPVFVLKLHHVLQPVVAVDVVIDSSAGREDFIPLFRRERELPPSLHCFPQPFQGPNRGAVFNQGIGVPNHHVSGFRGEHPGVHLFFFHEFEAAQELLPLKEDLVRRPVHLAVPAFGCIFG